MRGAAPSLSARGSVGVVGTTTTTTTKTGRRDHHRTRRMTSTTTTTTRAVATTPPDEQQRLFTKELKRPDENGRYGGVYGGKYVPETLIPALMDLEKEYEALKSDPAFIEEPDQVLKDYVGRANPLYFAERLSERYKKPDGSMPHIYFKREDLNHTGAHKINNAIGQAILAKRMGKKRRSLPKRAPDNTGWRRQRCARGMDWSVIYMGAADMERQKLNVFRMRLLGATVTPVRTGTSTLKDATSQAIRDWVTNVETTHYILGSVAGPHPYPMMVRDFHAMIGKEVRQQAMEKWGGKPDILIACASAEGRTRWVYSTSLWTTRMCV